MATPGLLAYIAISKYVDAMPLYRQEKAFERIGVELKRSTLALWMIRVGGLLQPILEALSRDLLQSPYLHMDETRIQVLHADGKPQPGLSQMWVRCNGESHQPIVLFDYDPTRSGSVPIRLLNGYSGYLVTDAYAGYNAVLKNPDIQGVGCWAHARRRFDEAIKAQKSKTQKAGKAHQGISYIQQLYRIERTIRDKPPDERLRIRQQEARPILDKIRVWVSQSLGQVPPASKLGKAIQYLQNEWDRLVIYIEDGRLPIDNNRCENAIRPFVIGRRNWLFADTDKGARASAAIYSVIECAKANGLDPYQYLRVLLSELPAIEGQSVDHLLPYSLDRNLLSGV
jgi:transposase